MPRIRKWQPQYLDRREEQVRAFIRECGALEHPVSLRLSADTQDDLQLIIDRLQEKHGDAIKLTAPRRGAENDWMCYGTFIR